MPSPRYAISGSKVLFNGKARIEVIGGIEAANDNLQYIP
jgi:hypothetical protein